MGAIHNEGLNAPKFLLFDHLKNVEELCIQVVFFSTQNQAQQIIIGISQVIYHIKAPLVVIRTTLNNFEKSLCRKKNEFETVF